MKWNGLIGLRLSELILKQLLAERQIKFQKSEEELRKQIERKIQENFEQEKQLLEEVYQMMEDLEQKGQAFERSKIFPLLKARLAKEKGFIL